MYKNTFKQKSGVMKMQFKLTDVFCITQLTYVDPTLCAM